MSMYSRLTSVSTQPGGRSTILFSGDVSSTRQHSTTDMPLKKIKEVYREDKNYCNFCLETECSRSFFSSVKVSVALASAEVIDLAGSVN